MSWLCCGTQKNYVDVNPTYIYHEFSRVDPKTGTHQVETFRYNPVSKYDHYRTWQRNKIKSLDANEVMEKLRNKGGTFIDQDFPHQQGSLGFEYQEKVQWKRVHNVIDNAVYYAKRGPDDLNNLQISNKPLQNALVILAKNQPARLQPLLTKELNDEGLYEYQFLIRGVLTNIVIDDYIPVFSNGPLFCTPFREREVFPILIQKALAKAYGSYREVPADTPSLLQTLACSPVMVQPVPLKTAPAEEWELFKAKVLDDSAFIIISKDDASIREYGLVENEAYQITEAHDIHVNSVPTRVYEFVNAQKLCGWNGQYSLYDEVWNNVLPMEKTALFNAVHRNRSFLMGERDISRFFSNCVVLQKRDGKCSDWLEVTSNQKHCVLFEFDIPAEDSIFLSVNTPEVIRTVAILARCVYNTYEFVAGNLAQNANVNSIKAKVTPGKYVVFVKTEWVAKQNDIFSLLVYSNSQIDLKKSTKEQHPDFLSKMFRNIASNNMFVKNVLESTHYSITTLYKETGYAFICLKIDENSQEKFQFNIDERSLYEQGFKLRRPHKGKGAIVMSAANSTEVVTLKILNQPSSSKVVFPSQDFKIIKIF